jgi:hypothetical protein
MVRTASTFALTIYFAACGGNILTPDPGNATSDAGTVGAPDRDAAKIQIACDDGTGNSDCCPPDAKGGAVCSVANAECFTRCSGEGLRGHLFCGTDGTWIAGRGLFPCGEGDSGASR